jgi:transposase-like protein
MSLAFARYVHILHGLMQKPEPREEARQLREQGVSIRQIGKELGVSRETVRKWCASDAPANPRTKHAPDVEAHYWQLRKSGLSIRKAAREMGLSKGTVQWWEDKSKRAA